MTNEHKLYLKKIKKTNFLIKLVQILVIVSFLVIWQILANYKMINTFIFSSPLNVLETLIELNNKSNLWSHIGITIWETVISFSLATILGIFIASILWWNNFLKRVIDPYLTVINSLPKVALGPIIIIWAGAGMKSIILMALLISLIITIITVLQGFNNTDPIKINLLKSFKATKSQIFFKLILPNSKKSIIEALKINISMSLIGVIMGEFLVSKKGIGYLIMYGSQVFNLDIVITGIFVLCLVAIFMYYLVSFFEKKIIK